MDIKIIRFSDPLKRKEIPYCQLADVHIGHVEFDQKLFEAVMKELWDEKCIIGLGGDTFDAVTKHAKGNTYEQIWDLNKCKAYITEKIKPFADAGLLTGVWSGNHCDRIYEDTNFDLIQDMAQQFGVPYFCYEGIIVFGAGYIGYTAFIQHGKRTGTTGNATNATYDMMKTVAGCDIYISQHHHWLGGEKIEVARPIINQLNPDVIMQEIALIKAGSFQARNRYAMKNAMCPKKLGVVKIYMKAANTRKGELEDKKKLWIEL